MQNLVSTIDIRQKPHKLTCTETCWHLAFFLCPQRADILQDPASCLIKPTFGVHDNVITCFGLNDYDNALNTRSLSLRLYIVII